MEPDDRIIIQDIGQTMLESKMIESVVTLLCTGIFSPLYIMAIYIVLKYACIGKYFYYGNSITDPFSRRKGQSPHSRATLGIVLFSLITSLGYAALRWMDAMMSFNCFLSDNKLCVVQLANDAIEISPSMPIIFVGSYSIIPIAMMWLSTFPLVFNDIIIVWRAWIIFEKRRWALVLSVGLCICSFVVTLMYLITNLSNGGTDWSTTPNEKPFNIPTIALYEDRSWTQMALGYVFFGLSLFTNVLATSFIGWTLWGHLRFLQNIGMSRQKLLGSWRILALLLDSGVIYCILQFIMFGLQFLNINLSSTSVGNFYIVFASLYRNISLLYPSLTILLIREFSSIEVFHNSVVALQTSKESPSV